MDVGFQFQRFLLIPFSLQNIQKYVNTVGKPEQNATKCLLC